MEMNIWFLICAGAMCVSGQFLATEYRLDSVPFPITRRINSAQYEIQPSIGREIEFITETAGTSIQGRRHIENNHRGNIQNGQINRNVDKFEINPYENIYQTDDRNYERQPANIGTNNNQRRRVNSENQFNARLQEQHQENYARETTNQNNNRNNENLNQNHRNNGETKLRTNLDNPQNNLQSNYPSNHNLRTSENSNQQNHRVYENSQSQSGPQIYTNTRNIDRTSQNDDNQPNYTSNTRINGKSTNQQTQANNNNEYVNNNRHAEASLRAIDSNSHGQQNVDSTYNNRNYNTKPSQQNTESTKEYDNRNYESSRQTTEPTKRITVDDKSVTGGTKSTKDNEIASRSNPGGRIGDNADDKWIWSNGGGKITKTTIEPTNPTVDDRAAFSGDKCPTGQVRFNNMCVDID